MNDNSIFIVKQFRELDGNLVCFESNQEIPFEIKRVFFISDVPFGYERTNHSSTNTNFVINVIRGRATIILDNGIKKREYVLDSPLKCLFVKKNTWMITKNFEKDSIMCVYADQIYSEAEYQLNYNDFLLTSSAEREKKNENNNNWSK